MTKPRYLTISWEQFHSDARALASKLINRKDLKKSSALPAAVCFPRPFWQENWKSAGSTPFAWSVMMKNPAAAMLLC